MLFVCKNFLNPIHTCSFLGGGFSIPCSHGCIFQILIPHDGPYGLLVPPCMASFCLCCTGHSHLCPQSTCQLAITIQLDCSFTDCWFWGMQSCFFCIHWADAQGDRDTWLQGSWCIFLKFLEVRVFGGFNDLILECLFHHSHIFIDYPSFVMLKLELALVGHGGIQRHHGVYSLVGQVGLNCGLEGTVDRQLHNVANVPMVSSFVWCWKGCIIVI